MPLPHPALAPSLQVRLAQSLKMDPERPEYHRVTLQWSRWGHGLCNYRVDFPHVTSDVNCLLCRRPGTSGAEGVDDSFAWWAVSTGNQISSRLLSARWAGGMHIVV